MQGNSCNRRCVKVISSWRFRWSCNLQNFEVEIRTEAPSFRDHVVCAKLAFALRPVSGDDFTAGLPPRRVVVLLLNRTWVHPIEP